MDHTPEGMDRREFLKAAGTLAALAGASPTLAGCEGAGPLLGRRAVDVVVVGAGAFGGWTALHLREMGHRVTLVDAYGPGNARATSGDETRGIRTGYGANELWTRWARQAIERWRERDQEWGTQLFSTTGDLIMREDWDGFMLDTRATWEKLGVPHEVLSHDELRYRYPQINVDGIDVALLEPDAGVGRSRQACLTVADQFRRRGGEVVLARASLGESAGGRLQNLSLAPGEKLGGEVFVLAVGPWFPKMFPELIGDKLRIPLGHVYYYGTPPGDNRFTYPNLPSYNFPGVTGWPALGHDSRGFRVRTGGRPPEDPDVSVRWIDERFHEQPRKLLEERFPAMATAPLLGTHSCHYELSASRNFFIDRHPEYDNVWVAGGGSAEGFKFGPVVGEYVAQRVTGMDTDAELTTAFRIPADSLASRAD